MTIRSAGHRGVASRLAVTGAVVLGVLVTVQCLPYLRGEVHPVLFSHLTLSRIAATVIAGAGLGLGGAILQGITRNPLASPGILGVTSGAHLLIALSLALTGGAVPLVLAAFLGAVGALVLTFSLAGPAGREGAGLALAGVAVNLCLSAMAAAVTLLRDQQMAGAFLWSAGAPVEAGWAPVQALAPWAVAGMTLAVLLPRGLDAMSLGATLAGSLGASPARLTAIGFLVCGLASGTAVALIGPVAFIGLLAPNALRHLGVRRHAWLLPLSALWGAALLAAADAVTGWVSGDGAQLPVGVVTSVVGAPVFLWLLVKSARSGMTADMATRTGRPSPLARAAAVLGVLLVVAASLAIGERVYSPSELLAVVHADGSDVAQTVVFELRLPRLLTALMAGALLALAGQLLQAVLRNPLAGPETLGVIQGAALASLLALLAGSAPGGVAMQAAGMAGALVAVGVVIGVSRRSGFQVSRMVLAGIALASLFVSVAALIVLLAQLQAAQALVWLTGSVYARGWDEAVALLPLGVPAVLLALWLGPRLDLAATGDRKAASLGLEPRRVRVVACLAASVAVAAAVSIAGSITFVGLLAPHMARLLHGGAFRSRLPMVLLLGALLVAAADLAGRTVAAPIQLPVGIMTALVGGPYFLWLLRRSLAA